MKIVYSTNPLIREVSKSVEKFDDNLRKLVDEMFLQMKEEKGIGLAAIQVGKPIRMFVIDISEKEDEDENENEKEEARGDCLNFGKFCMINPKIVWKSDEEVFSEEGCLSCPGVRAEVSRPEMVKVEYFDENGDKKSITACGLLATCIQHESDHLDGVLFIDYLSRIKQDMLFKKVAKTLEAK
jgi:peptide deformylase